MMNQSYMRLVSSMNGGLIIPTFTNTKSVLTDGVDQYISDLEFIYSVIAPGVSLPSWPSN